MATGYTVNIDYAGVWMWNFGIGLSTNKSEYWKYSGDDSPSNVYYTPNGNLLTLGALEYPVSVSFNGGKLNHRSDDWFPKGAVACDVYLCDSSYNTKIKLVTASGTNYDYDDAYTLGTYTIPADSGKQLAGKTLALWFAGHRGWNILSQMTVTINIGYTTTSCGNVSNVRLSQSLANGNITLSWSAGAGGINNAVSDYEIQYADSANGSSWGSWAAAGTSTSTSKVVGINGTQGYYRKFRIRTRGAAGASYYSGWVESGAVRTNIQPGVPGSRSVSPTLWESGNISLSWGASSGGTSSVTNYYLSSRTSSNGSSWGAWSAETNYGAGRSASLSPSLSRGYYIQYRVRAKDALGSYSGYGEFTAVRKNTLPGVSTGLSVSPVLWESGTFALSWTAAAKGTSNIAAYELQYAVFNKSANADGSWVSVNTGITGTTYTASAPSFDRGNKFRFRLRTRDALGACSDYAYFAYVTRNSIPGNPGTPLVSPWLYEEGEISLAWDAATDADGNLAVYDLRYSVSPDNLSWGDWQALDAVTETAYSHVPSLDILPRGSYIRYSVTARDALGQVSAAMVSSSVRRNTIPISPVIILPKQAEVHSLSPVFNVSWTADLEGQAQTLMVFVDEEQVNAVPVGLESGERCLRLPELPEGDHVVSFEVTDGMATSERVSMAISCIPIPWSRKIETGDVIANPEISHQQDIEEMVFYANEKRKIVGLETFRIAGNGYFASWLGIMVTLANRMQECYAAVGETVEQPSQSGNYPTAAMVNAVRLLIEGV